MARKPAGTTNAAYKAKEKDDTPVKMLTIDPATSYVNLMLKLEATPSYVLKCMASYGEYGKAPEVQALAAKPGSTNARKAVKLVFETIAANEGKEAAQRASFEMQKNESFIYALRKFYIPAAKESSKDNSDSKITAQRVAAAEELLANWPPKDTSAPLDIKATQVISNTSRWIKDLLPPKPEAAKKSGGRKKAGKTVLEEVPFDTPPAEAKPAATKTKAKPAAKKAAASKVAPKKAADKSKVAEAIKKAVADHGITVAALGKEIAKALAGTTAPSRPSAGTLATWVDDHRGKKSAQSLINAAAASAKKPAAKKTAAKKPAAKTAKKAAAKVPKGLYANIHAKQQRGEAPRKPGSEGAPTKKDFVAAAKTAKKKPSTKKAKS